MVLNPEERLELLSPYLEILRDCREQYGKSQAEIAEATNLSTKFVTFIEAGKRVPAIESILALMAEAGVRRSTAEQLMGELVDLFEWKE